MEDESEIGFNRPVAPNPLPAQQLQGGEYLPLTAIAWGFFLLLAMMGLLSFAQPFARNPFFSLASILVAMPTLRYGRQSRPLFVVCALWIGLVWGNKLLARLDIWTVTVSDVQVHLANGSKDSNWAFLVFQSPRGTVRQYFPIEARRFNPGEQVIVQVASGPLWTNVRAINSPKWSGEALLFSF